MFCLTKNAHATIGRMKIINHSIISFILVTIPIGFLLLKGYCNAALIVATMLAIAKIIRAPSVYLTNRSTLFWFCIISLCTPIICESFSQLLRGELILRSLDGPSRFILAAVVLVYVSRTNHANRILDRFKKNALIGASVAALLVIFLSQAYARGDRAATYFVDPNSLGIFLAFLAIIGYSSINTLEASIAKSSAKIIGLGLAFYAVIEAGTRAAWLAVLVTFLAYIFTAKRFSTRTRLLLLVFAVSTSWAIYVSSDLVRDRTDLFYENISRISEGTGNYKNNSIGIRLRLLEIDIDLIKKHPFGISDENFPELGDIQTRNPHITRKIWEIRKLAGSHAEIVSQLVKKGPVLGLVSVFSLMIFPLVFYSIAKRYPDLEKSLQPLPYLCIFLVVSSIGAEIFNLKMNSSFWGITLAIFYSAGINFIEQSGNQSRGNIFPNKYAFRSDDRKTN